MWRDAVLAEDCELPSTARLVAVALSMHMDADTLGDAYPGPARLARRTGLGQSTVKAALSLLVEQGWIKQTRRGGTAKGSSQRSASVYEGIPRPSTAPVQEQDGVTRPSRRRAPVQEQDETRPSRRRAPVQEQDETRPGAGQHLVHDLDNHLGSLADAPQTIDPAQAERARQLKAELATRRAS